MKTSVVVLAVLSLAILVSVSGRNVVQARDVWPGPDGVTAADGIHPGEAVITWSMVEKAAYYRIGWVAGSEYQARADGGADWQEGFVFTDVPNRGQASHLVTGLTPGGEYHFVVASHDGRIPTLEPPHEFASFRLADIPATSGNHPGQVRLEGPWRTDFPELWLNICRPDNSGRGRYCVTVPTGYVDFDETAEWIEGIREGAFFGLSGNLTDVEDRARFYRDMLLEMVIQPGTRGDVFRGEVLADFPETARATIELAEIVSESVEAFTELADSELFKAHLEHLHAHGFFPGAKLGTHLVDVAIAAAANRTIEIEEARKRLGLLKQDIRTAMPNDPAWEAAFGMVWQELEDMDNPDAMTRWSNALSDNLDEIALTISKFLVAHAAKTAAVAGAKAAATALGATVSIPAAPITLTVGLAVWVVYYVIEETDQFWDELILSSTALQVYLAMTSIKREEDEDNILGYATFAFYHHLHNAIDTSVWIFDFNEQQLKSNRVSVMERRDQLLVQMIDTPWMPDEDFNGISITYPEGITSDATTMWVADDVSNTIYAFSLATKTRHSAKDIGLPKLSLRGIWHAGAIMWLADSSGRGIFAYHVERDFLDDENTIVVRQASNAYPAGVWSEKDTLWVADSEDAKIYAYNIGTKRRYPPKDLDGLRAAGNDDPYGIWSDGETMWVADREDDKVYAYTLATARRDVSREFELINVPGVVHNGGPTGIWSNGETMWVADDMDPYTDGKIYAYQLPPQPTSDPAAIPFQHNPSKELSRLNLAENHDAEGIWSDGQTMWVADQNDDRVYAYRMSDGARAGPQNEEFHLAGSGSFGGQDHATGIWSDGATIWIADHDDDHIYAYRLSDGARVEDEEYDLNQPSVHAEYATGIWFDSTNGRMWVADRLAGKIYGFDANSKELVGTIDALDCSGNHNPQGIWSDGTTMWVADDADDRIYAYSIGDNLRDPGREFDALKAANNHDARGIWSDGRTTMWVADQDKNWIYAYNMPEPLLFTPAPAVLGNPSHLVVGPAGLHGVVTLNWRPAANANIHRIYLTNADGTESRYWDFELCGDANAAMIGLRHRDQEYRFRVIAGLRGTDGNIQWSDGSEWSYPILGDGFSHAVIPSLGNPTSLAAAPGSQSGEVALSWSQAANATVHWVYLVKPDGTDGRYWPHALAGDAATLAVTGLDAGETYLFLVIAGQEQADGTPLWSQWSNWAEGVPGGEAFARNPGADFNGLMAAGNNKPWGLWSDGITMWVGDEDEGKIYAYDLRTKSRVPAEEFNNLVSTGRDGLTGIWSDGITMWTVDYRSQKIFAYDMDTKRRVPIEEFDTLIAAGNSRPNGIWSDGATLWVGNWGAVKIFAYDLKSKERIPSQDFDTLRAAGNEEPEGIWSDGTTMWVLDWADRKIYAYDMQSKERVPAMDYHLAGPAGHSDLKGIWSDGTTMWVAHAIDDKIYAYNMPAAATGTGSLANLDGLLAASGETLSSGVAHTCGLRADGTAVCWGWNDHGQATAPAGETFTAISSGRRHTCGLRIDGTAICWGDNIRGQASPPGGGTFTTISSGRTYTCGLRPGGSAACWGIGGGSQPPPGETFTAISSGGGHACGLRGNASVVCWGHGYYGNTPPPKPVGTFSVISSGEDHLCGLNENGSAVCSGDNYYGQTTSPKSATFTAISSGGFHTCGLQTNGSVTCWGYSTDGQATPPPGETFTAISSGTTHTCGLRANGSVACWGLNDYGQATPAAGVTFAVNQ